MAKQKQYRLLRLTKMRNCAFMLTDIVMMAKKSQVDGIPLPFLKEIEKRIQAWHTLIIQGSRIPEKKDISPKGVD